MKRVLVLLLAAALTATLVSGCSLKKEKPLPPVPTLDTAINIQLGGEPDRLDPAFAVTAPEESYLLHLLEGLTTLDDRLKPVPGVAESWERTVSDAGVITYLFKLNPEAKWSDGTAVKAEDFIYAWRRVLDPATRSPLAYRLYPIKGAYDIHEGSAELSTLGVAVNEDGSLQVVLEGECYDFLQQLATAPWMPLRESVVSAKQEGWYYDEAKYLTNGPYILKDWARDQQITMERSESYRDRKNVKAKTLNFVLMEDEGALLAALKEGSIHLATNLPLMELEAMDGTQQHCDTLLGSYTLAFNAQNKPFDDAKVRRALSLAIDRQALAREQRDGSVAALGLVPKGALMDGTDFRQKSGDLLRATADLEQAKKLLAQAGYPDGKGIPPVKFLINDEEAHRRMAQNVAKMWEPLGVTVEVVSEKWDDYKISREDGRFDVTRISLFSDNLYPSAFFDGWVSGSALNYAGYSSKAYDDLIDLSYGREPKKAEEAAEGDKAAGDKSAASKPAEKKPEEKKADASSGSESGKAEETPVVKAPIQCLAEAEKLLVDTDAVVVPLTWYTNRYATAVGFGGFRSYPAGTLYFGNAVYEPAAGK